MCRLIYIFTYIMKQSCWKSTVEPKRLTRPSQLTKESTNIQGITLTLEIDGFFQHSSLDTTGVRGEKRK